MYWLLWKCSRYYSWLYHWPYSRNHTKKRKKVSGYPGRYFHVKEKSEVTNDQTYFSVPHLDDLMEAPPHGMEWRGILTPEFRIKDVCSWPVKQFLMATYFLYNMWGLFWKVVMLMCKIFVSLSWLLNDVIQWLRHALHERICCHW